MNKKYYVMRVLSPASNTIAGYVFNVRAGKRSGKVTGFAVTDKLRDAIHFLDYDYAEKVAISLSDRYNLDVAID